MALNPLAIIALQIKLVLILVHAEPFDVTGFASEDRALISKVGGCIARLGSVVERKGGGFGWSNGWEARCEAQHVRIWSHRIAGMGAHRTQDQPRSRHRPRGP